MAKNSNQNRGNAASAAAVASPNDVLGSLPKTVSSGSDNGASTADLQKSAVAALAEVPETMLPPAPETVAPPIAAQPAKVPEAEVPEVILPPAPGELSDAGGKGEPTGNPSTATTTVSAGTTIVAQGVGPGRYRVTCQPATPVTSHEIELDCDSDDAAWKKWLDLNGISSTSADRRITRLSDKTGAEIVQAPTIKPVYKQTAVELSEIVD